MRQIDVGEKRGNGGGEENNNRNVVASFLTDVAPTTKPWLVPRVRII